MNKSQQILPGKLQSMLQWESARKLDCRVKENFLKKCYLALNVSYVRLMRERERERPREQGHLLRS